MRLEKVRIATFYTTPSGNEPVRKWLQGLSGEDRNSVGKDLARVEYGAKLTLPLVDNLGDGLWEVRTRLRRGRIARVFFFLDGSEMVLVHGIMKKSRKTPAQDLKTARQRKRDWEKDNG